MRLRSLHRAYPSIHPSGVVHWVPEQLNITAVTEANWLMVAALCCVWPQFQWYHLAYATEMKSIQLHDSIVMASPWDSISYIYIFIHIYNEILNRISILFVINVSLFHRICLVGGRIMSRELVKIHECYKNESDQSSKLFQLFCVNSTIPESEYSPDCKYYKTNDVLLVPGIPGLASGIFYSMYCLILCFLIYSSVRRRKFNYRWRVFQVPASLP